jgi:hypothetical protein
VPAKPLPARARILMNNPADPRLVWVATVLATAVFILYVTHI